MAGTSATQGAIRAVLGRLSHYADFDVDQAATSLWAGSLTLRNVQLRVGAFHHAASVGLAG